MSQLRIHSALFAVGLIYGANYSIAKLAMPELIGPFGFILVRVAASALLFWIAHFFLVKGEEIRRKDIGRLILCTVFGVWVNQLSFFQGLSMTSPINASIIMTISPIVVVAGAAILLNERINLRMVLGILLGITGAVSLILQNNNQFEGINVWGDLLILVNASSYGVYLVLVKPLMKKYHALTVIKWIFLMGIPLILPFGWNQLGDVNWTTLPDYGWFSILYVIVFTTFLTYFLNAWSMKHVSPSLVGYYIYIQPVFATFFSMLLLGDQLYLFQVVSSLLIFMGVFLVSKN